ncbi:hypothetical protein QR680_004343 [Steinernema hermaphroditum]|uniref:DNA2/NAM7 helicase helicase domain-containing protein n=1 Tax=Steinernema hermaphroditum TaxID=289476 RepID=A0AA39HQM3_9BILA|nr:hypothetical protein QR680_004343 [Steinernema hermaphroditum]
MLSTNEEYARRRPSTALSETKARRAFITNRCNNCYRVQSFATYDHYGGAEPHINNCMLPCAICRQPKRDCPHSLEAAGTVENRKALYESEYRKECARYGLRPSSAASVINITKFFDDLWPIVDELRAKGPVVNSADVRNHINAGNLIRALGFKPHQEMTLALEAEEERFHLYLKKFTTESYFVMKPVTVKDVGIIEDQNHKALREALESKNYEGLYWITQCSKSWKRFIEEHCDLGVTFKFTFRNNVIKTDSSKAAHVFIQGRHEYFYVFFMSGHEKADLHEGLWNALTRENNELRVCCTIQPHRKVENLIFDSWTQLKPPANSLASELFDPFFPGLERSGLNRTEIGMDLITRLLPVFALNKSQEVAVRSAFSNSLSVVWGPPGTGKTTVIETILAIWAVVMEMMTLRGEQKTPGKSALVNKQLEVSSEIKMCVENAYKHCIFDPDRCVDINGMKCCASNRADVNMIPLVHRQYPQRLDLEFDDSMADGYDLSSDDAKNAVFWFMTVDMAILHSREMRFESLLVDECSAVTIPQLYGLFVAAQWPDFLCAVGDPKQLGPHPGTHMIDLDTTKQYTERKRRNLKTDKDLEKLSTV